MKIRAREQTRRLLQALRRTGFDPTNTGNRQVERAKILAKWAATYRAEIDAGRLPSLTRKDITVEVELDQTAFGILFEWLTDIPEPERIYCVAALLDAPSRKKTKGTP